MGSLAIAGKLAIVEIGDVKPPATPAVWTELTEVVDIGDVPFVRETYDATFHSDSIYRAQMIGLAEPMNITLTLNYVNTQYAALWALANNTAADGPLEWFRIVWPDGWWHRFEAFVSGMTATTPLDDRITYQCNLSTTQDFYFENA